MQIVAKNDDQGAAGLKEEMGEVRIIQRDTEQHLEQMNG